MKCKQSTLAGFFKPAKKGAAKPVEKKQDEKPKQIVEEKKSDEGDLQPHIYPNGTCISKQFLPDKTYYDGTITEYDEEEKWYKVAYEDGDTEDLTHEEVCKCAKKTKTPVVVAAAVAAKKRKIGKAAPASVRKKAAVVKKDDDEEMEDVGASRASSRSRSKKVTYAIDDSSDEEEFMESDEDVKPRARGKPPAKSKPPAKQKIQKGGKKDDNSDFEGFDDEDSEDEPLEDVDEDEDDSEVEAPKKKAKTVAAAKKPKAKKEEKDTDKKKMSESFEPKNYPDYQKLSLQQIHEKKEFLDPCGMEATDGIIDRLVGEQVDKLGGLLLRALKNEESMGSIAEALKLGTACSGTDAPALALTLVKEQMEQRNLQALNFTHEFSCEVDPFKQGTCCELQCTCFEPRHALLTTLFYCSLFGSQL